MRDKVEDPEQRRTWETVAEQAHRLSDIISELMEFASPAAPKPETLAARAALAEAARAFSSSDHPQAESCEVDIEVDDDVPPLSADAGQLQAVLTALLENAAAAVGDGGRVVLSAASNAGPRDVLLRVEDDGPGMNGETLARVWTPFYSAQKAGRRRGLGLAKAKRYTENNGGKIWIDSEPGKGTVVSVQLPAADPDTRQDEAEHGDPQDGPSTGGG
jgi:signal transduction histidine kinase